MPKLKNKRDVQTFILGVCLGLWLPSPKRRFDPRYAGRESVNAPTLTATSPKPRS